MTTVGTRVRIERDETRYPSKGTWPEFRGKTGTVIEVNHDRQQPHLTEYGIAFGKVWPRPDRPGTLNFSDSNLTWFKLHEIRRTAFQGPLSGRYDLAPSNDAGKVLAHV